MATVPVTGSLKDFGLASINARHPRIIFTPSGPAFGGSTVLATPPIVVEPDSGGAFSVNLTTGESLRPFRWFTVRIEWLDSASNYIGMDFIEEFKVPPGGGAMGDLAALDFDPTSVWVSATPPASPAISTWWLSTTTGDLYEWSA